MATKTSAVLETAVNKIPPRELTPGAAVQEWTVMPSGSDCSTRRERLIHFEPDNYQVALVSFHNGQDRSGGNAQSAGRMDQLFLLPMTWKEFMTRGRAAFSHSNSAEGKIVRFDRVSIDFLSMEVRRSDRPVSLTAMEFKVLKFFVSNPNRVISRDHLLNEVWGYDNYPCTRTVDNHVLKLRQKLESDPADPVHFLTVHGAGYKFVP